jgi:integrase
MMVLGLRQTPPLVGRIPHFPKLSEDNVREGFFEHDEFLALRGAAPDHLKIAMTVGYYTGMRQGEIIGEQGLRWDQVNLVEGTIRLSSTQTKTKTPRVIYMTGDFLMVMIKAKELRDRCFPHCPYVCQLGGQPFKEIQTAWASACRRVGLKGKTFHDLRRTGVRNLVRAGVPETVAMKISGHKTRSVFDRYNITSEEDLRNAATRLNDYIEEKKVTFSVTLDELYEQTKERSGTEMLEKAGSRLELARGIEPPTGGLQNHCSAD